MKIISSIIGVFVLLMLGIIPAGNAQNQVVYPAELQQLHQNVRENIMANPANVTEVANLLSKLTENGSWPDIDYTSKQRGAWEPNSHNSRLLAISKAYQTKGSKFYHKKEVSDKIHLGLNFWLENDFQCPNWWYPEIGVPMVFAPVMILMEDELSPEQMQKGIKILDRSKIGMTGQNKVWQSGNVLLKSLLLKDSETIKKAAESIQEELVVSTGEGVQPDWSYHQHGPQLQFGNYGLSYVGDMIKWISILRQTPFHFDETKVEILRNYLLNGLQWVTWKDQMDISACGRQLFVGSPEQKAGSLAGDFTKMEKLDPQHSADYKKANHYKNLSGNKHFWRSDFQVQRNSDYYFSVKMNSKRVIGAESCNSENLQGYYMGDGATFLYQTGEEYRDIFPFLDWKKIPGTTTMQNDEKLPVLTASGYRIESNFVGGVSDGENGVAAMDYNRNGLTARKSWFMFDDMIVCLGAGISSSENLPVTTGVSQVYCNGEIASQMKDEKEQTYDWVLHNGVGYYFPGGSKIKLSAKMDDGSWNWVASRYPEEILHAKIFRLWLEHGVNPKNESYEYILVPKATSANLKNMESNFPFKISNKTNRQEVAAVDGNVAGFVFYEAGKSEAFGGVEVNDPCMLMLKKQKNGLQLSVSDPTQLLTEINVTLNGEYLGKSTNVQNGKTTINVLLPKEGDAGKTENVLLERNM